MIDSIAVIGYSGRFPGAPDADALWRNLREGRESITFFTGDELLAAGVDPALLAQPNYVRAAATLEGVESFDAAFFGYSPREAEVMDPQQRVFLETAHAALEHSGYEPRSFDGRIGVYAGSGMNTYLLGNLMTHPDVLEGLGALQVLIGSDKDFLSTRVSYKLDLRGPSVTVQTACSTSLVAVAMACQSLMNVECDIALAGGVTIRVPQRSGYLYQEEGILSPDGHCRPFDAAARGTVPGSGAGVVVLKRLSDAIQDRDRIHAVIRGWATNNDGSQKAGFTAPSVEGQSEAIVEAMAVAGVDPGTIQYVETHGTGTNLGDPIEVRALARAFENVPPRSCAIGAVKSNFGHLDGAAGVTGLIKTILALGAREIPPTLHFEKANPLIDFDATPFHVNGDLREWSTNGQPRRAGVSSFGIGGTNAHVIVEEAPAVHRSTDGPSHALFVFSARSDEALDAMTSRFDEWTHDASYTLQVGRTAHAHRRAMVVECGGKSSDFQRDGIAAALQKVFLFPGQGAQYVGMADELYATYPVFREEFDRCCAILGTDIRCLTQEQLEQTQFTQPALFIVEYALARLWMSLGVQPDAMLGHSVGEYVAATLAGVFTLEDALRVVAKRGALIQELERGAMIAVPLPESDVLPLLGERLSIAGVNTPSLCTVSGPTGDIEALERTLAVATRRLHTSHAFHSSMMDGILETFRQEVARVALHPPQIPFVSNVTGTWITAAQACDPDYWTMHVRQTVRFSDGVKTLLEDAQRIFLEVGPGQTLTSFVRQHGRRTVIASMRHPQEEATGVATFLGAIGDAWVAGVDIEWEALHRPHERGRVPLPTYPFERVRHWIEPNREGKERRVIDERPIDERFYPHARNAGVSPAGPAASSPPRPRAAGRQPETDIEKTVAAIWQEALGAQTGADDDFFELGGNSLIGLQILSRLRAEFHVELPLRSFFEARTVAGMARLIESEMSSDADEAARMDAILAGIESLSDEEVERELTEEIAVIEPDTIEPHVCRGMRFGIFFFSADGSGASAGKYDLLLDCARFADARGFDAVWTPERHFVGFGGLYPNPSVLGAALALATQRIQIRAGSVVLPLHHPIRIAEEWAVVDNLSRGRVAISCATGWHPEDFVMAPEQYASRREVMFRGMNDVRRLWSGESVTFRGVDGKDVEVRTYPRPVQRELPMWVTSSGNADTWVRAGDAGANVLATMGNQSEGELADKVGRYRDARRRAGFDPSSGVVSLMLHTFVGIDDEEVRQIVRAPMSDYLFAHMQQRDSYVQIDGVREEDKRALTELAFEHYFEQASLLGTPEKCSRMIERLERSGIDEVACLVDFGVDAASVLGSLELLDDVRRAHALTVPRSLLPGHQRPGENAPATGHGQPATDLTQEVAQ